MEFKHFEPSDTLKPYVQSFYNFISEEETIFTDTVFPSGNMEIIFNLGEGSWESLVGERFFKTPAIELWGQITKPLTVRSIGKHDMFGVKFLPHSASYFFLSEIGTFNDQVSDLRDVMGNSVKELYAQLLETKDTSRRIEFVENYLLKRLLKNEKGIYKFDKVSDILTSIKINASHSNITNIAFDFGITPRHLHKLIFQHTGLSPKSFNKISRFQLSLQLIAKKEQPLTSVAYDCGYFDQSHFIRDFKFFTGVTPKTYLENRFPVNQILLQ